MEDNAVPILPIITNTFFPPNQPVEHDVFQGKETGKDSADEGA